MKVNLKFIIFNLLLILCIINNDLSCQTLEQIDSLKRVSYQLANNTQKVDNLNKLAYWYGSINIDSSLHYSLRAKQKAILVNYKRGVGIAYNYSARAYIEKGNFKESINYFTKANDIFSELKDTVMLLDCYMGMSYVYSYSSNQIKSLNLNLTALRLAQSINDTTTFAIVYNNIGAIYKKLNNFDLALFYFQKSLKYDKLNRLTIPRDLAVSYSNIGLLKVRNGKTINATSDYNELFKLLPKVKSDYLKVNFFLSISEYYNSKQLIDSSQYYIKLAEELNPSHTIPQIHSKLYKRKGELYLSIKKYDSAIQYLDSCILISQKSKIQNHLAEVFQLKAKAYFKKQKYKEAYLAIQESVKPNYLFKSQKIAGLLGEFENEQKTKDEKERHYLKQALKFQQAENETIKLKSRIWLAIGVLSILCISILIIVYFLIKVKKQNSILHIQHRTINQQKQLLENNIEEINIKTEKLHTLNATKDKFFTIIAHDLKSPFTSLIGLSNELALSYNDYNDKERVSRIKLIEKTSESTFNLLENLLYWANSQRGIIKVNKHIYSLNEIISQSISAYLVAAKIKDIKVTLNIDHDILVLTDMDTIKIVISNIFNNAIKFTKPGGKISFMCNKKDNHIITCISDNGIGMSEEIKASLFKIDKNVQRSGTEQEKGTGLGLIICKEFIEKNNGQIWVESKESIGSNFYFSLPIANNLNST